MWRTESVGLSHFHALPTKRPSDFPEADSSLASTVVSPGTQSRPDGDRSPTVGRLGRAQDYLTVGDVTTSNRSPILRSQFAVADKPRVIEDDSNRHGQRSAHRCAVRSEVSANASREEGRVPRPGLRLNASSRRAVQYRIRVTCCGSMCFATCCSDGCWMIIRPILKPGTQTSLR